MIEWIKKEWINLASVYCKDTFIRNGVWEEIIRHYSHKSRYYHNLEHIYNMLMQAEEVKS